MTIYNMLDAKTNLSKIAKQIETGEEDYIVIARNGKPILRIIPEPSNYVGIRIGAGKGMFSIPDDFDDMDIASDFSGEIF